MYNSSLRAIIKTKNLARQFTVNLCAVQKVMITRYLIPKCRIVSMFEIIYSANPFNEADRKRKQPSVPKENK